MGVLVQIRDLPEPVHRTLKARAAAAGTSLSEYLRALLAREAARPTPDELAALLARFEREIEQRFALRCAGARVGKNHRMTKDDRAVFRPQVEMTDPQPRIHVHEQIGDAAAPTA